METRTAWQLPGLVLGLVALAAVLGTATVEAGARAPTVGDLLPPSFTMIKPGSAGGAVWEGVIPGMARASAIYLPPNAVRAARYPVVYLLHGMPGSPVEYYQALHLAKVADGLITSGAVTPFIAVMPVAGPTWRYNGEWAGPWESSLLRQVLPWVESTLPVRTDAAGRTIAGLSAGGYGAANIGLRNPLLFGTIESWSGYFSPFRDGPLARATATTLAANAPTLVAAREAPLLRRLGTRIFLGAAPTHGNVRRQETLDFARKLTGLRIDHRLIVLRPGARRIYESQMVLGLRYALAPR